MIYRDPFRSVPNCAASLTCWTPGHHPVSLCPPRLFFTLSFNIQSKCGLLRLTTGSRGLPSSTPSTRPPLPRNCSALRGAQQTCVEGRGTEKHRRSRDCLSQRRALDGPGELSPGWLFTGTQLRISAVVLWNLDVTNLKCTTINYKINHLSNSKKRKDASHLNSNFFPLSESFSSSGKG